jgi:hypothetical protein
MMIVIDKFGRQRYEPDGYTLQDGEKMFVPLHFMDGVQREVAKSWPPDLTASTGDARFDAYLDYKQQVAERWRQCPLIDDEAVTTKPASAGDPRTDAYAYCVSLANRWQAR